MNFIVSDQKKSSFNIADSKDDIIGAEFNLNKISEDNVEDIFPATSIARTKALYLLLCSKTGS